MVERIQAEMATSIALDVVKATSSLRGLSDAVNSVKNAWKSQEAAAKSSGDYLKAAEERYNGLGRQMDVQKTKISELEQRQKGLDTSTKDGAESFLKYEKNIQQANQQLANLEAQQQRAKSSLEYQKSGLAQLQNEYKQTNALSESYVNRLKAEGKERQANIINANNLKVSLSNLSEQYVKQSDELKRIESESGIASEAYRKQSVRVNNTATDISKMKDEVKSAQREVNAANPYGFSKFASGANIAYRSASKMGDGIHYATQKAKEFAAAGAIVTVGLGAIATKGVQTATDLENSFTKTYNLAETGGEKAAEAQRNVNQMQKDGAKLSVEYGKSQLEIADGYQELIKRGYTTTSALGSMRSELEASVASGDDFNNVLSVTSQVVDAYGLRVDDANQMIKNTKDVTNQLAYAADMTATDFQSMGKGMEYVADTAHSAGIELSTTSSAMGILSNHGLEADKAGTGLRKVINSLTGALGEQIAAQEKSADGQAKINQKIDEQKQKVQEAQDAVNKATEAEKNSTKGKKNFAKQVESSNKQLKKQQENLDKLEGKAQAASGAQDMLSSLGISRDQLVNSNGHLKSMSEIMKVINDHTKDIKDADVKNNIFHALFGTTGMQAGIILAQNNDELEELDKKVRNAADGQGYVQNLAQKNMNTTKAKLDQLKSSMDLIVNSVGASLLPSVSEFATKLADALNSDKGQKKLQELSKTVGEVGRDIVNVIKFMWGHRSELEIVGKTIVGIWAINKLGKFIGMLRNTVGIFKELKKAAIDFKAVDALSSISVGGVAKNGSNVAGSATEVGATTIGSRAAGSGGAYVKNAGKLGTAMNATKGVAGVAAKYAGIFGAAFTAVDLGGSVVKALNSNEAKDKYKASAQGAGTFIGGAVGGVLGSVIPGAGTVVGAGLGASIGNELGKAGWASDAAAKISKALSKAFEEHPVDPKKVTQKSAEKELADQYKKYYKEKAEADQKDIDLLHKNGLITDEEYSRRIEEIKKEGEKASDFEKMSQEDRTNITKYYEIQRKDLENSFSKEKKSVRDKWDKQITQDAAKYGEASTKVKEDYQKRDKALDELESNRKSEVSKLSIENVTKTTAEEARLHVTSAGKVDLANQNLIKSRSEMLSKISQLSDKQKQKIVNNAQEEYERVKYYSDKTYRESKEAADKKFKENTKAADNQFNSVKESAEKERDAVIAAGNKQFQGTSKYAVEQRKAIVDQANKTYEQKVKSASDTHQEVYDKAEAERKDTLRSAQQKKDDNIKQAEQEKNEISGKAGKQAENVKGSSDDTHKHVKKGSEDFWTSFIAYIGQSLGLSAKNVNTAIDSINAVLHSFGAGKQTIKPMQEKYASGTGLFSNERRPINKPTFALLNDGNDSPETENKEALVHPNGNMEIVQGQNVSRWLAPGTEVINAKELSVLMGSRTPFANGTGWLGNIVDGTTSVGSWAGKVVGDTWSGMKNGIEKFTNMFKYITNAVSHPSETLSEQFSAKREGNKGDVFNTIMDGTLGKVKDQAKDWWSTLWGMANNSANSGNADGQGDNYPWKSVGKDSGADPWGYFYRECVSYVANSLKNMGVSTSLFSGLGNGSDWVNAPVRHTNDPKPGMVAVYGPGSEFGNHVAMVRGVKGKSFSGEEYNWGGDGNYHTYSGRSKSGVTTFLDFGKSGGGEKSVESNKPLQKLIKGQVGGMFDWIQKFIGPVNDTSTGVGGDVQSWSNDVKKALSTLGLSTSGNMVSRVLRQIQTESGGNAKAIGGNDGLADGNATGLMQVKPGTFNAFKLAGHDNILNGYDNMLAGLNYAKSRYGDDLSFLGQGHGYANGVITNHPHVAHIAEGGKTEAVIPWDLSKKSRAMELLGETVTHFASNEIHNPQDNSDNNSDNLSNDSVIAELKNAVSLLTQLVIGQKENQTTNVVLDKNDIYKKQAIDTELRNYQSFA